MQAEASGAGCAVPTSIGQRNTEISAVGLHTNLQKNLKHHE